VRRYTKGASDVDHLKLSRFEQLRILRADADLFGRKTFG
jgi:hypothetical protein